MKVKELKKTVNVCWSPAELYPTMLAAGSAAQQVDPTFSSSSQLELYSLNLDDSSLDLKLKSSLETQHKFQKIVWSGAGTLVGGCDGGLLEFYNAEKLLSGAPDALVSSSKKHNGDVTALDVNPYQKNLLASGASESEIYIWDLNNTTQPMAPGSASQPLDHVQGLAWNQQVQHILGSTFATRCVVWDLRKNEPIMKLSDAASSPRWRALAWHPRVATQLCVASEADRAPVVQLWDLRLASSPVVTMEGHQKGVMSLSWCPHDEDLLLSAGRDGRVLCWNPNNTKPGGELVCEVAAEPQWAFSVAWAPRAGLLAAGRPQALHVHSLLGGSVTHQSAESALSFAESFGGAASLHALPAVSSAPPAAAPPLPPRPPRWLRKLPKSRFGFGGKLVTFAEPRDGAQHVLYVSQVVSDPELVSQAAELEAALEQAQTPEVLAEYCRVRGDAATSQDERYCWFFLRANFLPTFRTEVLNLLGFKQDEIPSKFKAPSAAPGNEQNDIAALSRGESTETEAELSTDTSTDVSDANTLIERKLACIDLGDPPSDIVIPDGEDSTSLICRALVCGNLEEAVELCLEAGRVADAMLIASLGSQELVTKVQLYHLSRSAADPVSLLAGAVLRGGWRRLLAAPSYRHVLAALMTHAGDDAAKYAELLGDKLSKEAEPAAATLCYLCSLSLAQLARGWRRERLRDAAEKVLVARKAMQMKGMQPAPGPDGSEPILSMYAAALSAQGALQPALRLLRDAGGELRERLLTATRGYSDVQQGAPPPGQRGRVLQRDAPGQYNTANAYESSWQQATVAPPQPPRPASGGPQGSISGRSKYKVDPSVQSAPLYNQYSFSNPIVSQPSYGYNSPMPEQYNNSNVPSSYVPNQSNFMNPAVNPGLNSMNPGLTPLNPGLNPLNPGLNSLNPAVNSLNPDVNSLNPPLNPLNPPNLAVSHQQMNGNYYNPPMQAPMQEAPVPSKPIPPGWNDPPMMTSKPKPKQENPPAQAPITHPLFGVEQPQYVPLNPQYGAPPNVMQASGQSVMQPSGQSVMQSSGQSVMQPSGQSVMQPSGQSVMPGGQYSDQHQQYNNNMAPAYAQKINPQPAPAEAPRKAPLPAEHRALQAVLDALHAQCAERATNPQMKRKLEDVHRRLETLYDMLREYRLSEAALSTLHACAAAARAGDYAGAGAGAAALAGGADFAAAAAFLPALKVLMQCAQQLQVQL